MTLAPKVLRMKPNDIYSLTDIFRGNHSSDLFAIENETFEIKNSLSCLYQNCLLFWWHFREMFFGWFSAKVSVLFQSLYRFCYHGF